MRQSIKLRMKKAFLFTFLSTAVLFMASCNDDNDVTPNGKDSTGIAASGIDTVNIPDLPIGVLFNHSEESDTIDHYVLFRFSDAKVVPIKDSAKGNWDIGFYGKNIMAATDIILNSSMHGSGSVEGQILDQPFDEVLNAPQDGYSVDSPDSSTIDIGPHPTPVYPTDVFTIAPYYTGPPNHLILPDTSMTYIIHTNDDKYVKLSITNAYKGDPKAEDLDFKTSEFGYFTFKYVINQDGDRNFTE